MIDRDLGEDLRSGTARARDRDRPVQSSQAVGETTQAAARTRVRATDPIVIDLDAQVIVDTSVSMRPDGSRLRRLTHFHDPQMNAFFGSYSPDGRWLVYRLEDHGRFALNRMRPDGSHVQTILPLSTFRPFLIDWGTTADGDGED